MAQPRLLAGASGYSFPAWKGVFYPAGMKSDAMLPFYGQHLPTVEINSSFYGMPPPERLQKWAEQTPPHFRFTIKAPRAITHDGRIKVEKVAEPLGLLYRNLAALGGKQGPVLFQLPPNLKKDTARLAAFLQLLPQDHGAVFEFRNPSWFDEEIYGLLRQAGAVLCLSERENNDPPPLVETAPWGHVRLRLETYSDEDLRQWALRLLTTGWQRIYVYFMHEATASDYALRLMRHAAEAGA